MKVVGRVTALAAIALLALAAASASATASPARRGAADKLVAPTCNTVPAAVLASYLGGKKGAVLYHSSSVTLAHPQPGAPGTAGEFQCSYKGGTITYLPRQTRASFAVQLAASKECCHGRQLSGIGSGAFVTGEASASMGGGEAGVYVLEGPYMFWIVEGHPNTPPAKMEALARKTVALIKSGKTSTPFCPPHCGRH